MSSSIYEEHDDTILYTLKELGIIKAAGPVPKHKLYRGKKERKEKKETFFYLFFISHHHRQLGDVLSFLPVDEKSEEKKGKEGGAGQAIAIVQAMKHHKPNKRKEAVYSRKR